MVFLPPGGTKPLLIKWAVFTLRILGKIKQMTQAFGCSDSYNMEIHPSIQAMRLLIKIVSILKYDRSESGQNRDLSFTGTTCYTKRNTHICWYSSSWMMEFILNLWAWTSLSILAWFSAQILWKLQPQLQHTLVLMRPNAVIYSVTMVTPCLPWKAGLELLPMNWHTKVTTEKCVCCGWIFFSMFISYLLIC